MEQEIGKRILQLRLRQGLTQAQLADGICDRSHISIIESGRRAPSIALLEKLATRLRLTLPDLLGETVPPSRESSFSFELLMDHLHLLLNEHEYRDACILIRKQLRHPDIAAAPDKLSRLHRLVGIAEALSDNEERADAYFEKSEEYANVTRDRIIMLEIRLSRAALDNRRNEFASAEQRYRQAQADAPRDLPLPTRTKIAYGLGIALAGQGRHRPALSALSPALDRLMQHNSMYLVGELATAIARCYERLGDYASALLPLQKAVGFHLFSGDRRAEQECYIQLAACHRALGQTAEANTCEERARSLEPLLAASKPRPAALIY